MTTRDAGPTPGWPGDSAELTAEAVDFEALGHVLGNTCCWGGRTRRFYSVAQHALTVSNAVQALGGLEEEDGRRLALHALLADAWRAWLTEPGGADTSAKALEKHRRERAAVQRAVLEAAGADPELPPIWSQALELTQRMAEAALVRDMPNAGMDRAAPLFRPLKQRTRPLHPDKAAERWIEALQGLRPAGLRPEALRAAALQAADSRVPESRVQAPRGAT